MTLTLIWFLSYVCLITLKILIHFFKFLHVHFESWVDLFAWYPEGTCGAFIIAWTLIWFLSHVCLITFICFLSNMLLQTLVWFLSCVLFFDCRIFLLLWHWHWYGFSPMCAWLHLYNKYIYIYKYFSYKSLCPRKTHRLTQTHLEFKVKVSNLKPSQKDDHTQQQLQQQTTADNTHTHTRTEATAILAMHNNAFRVKNLRIWNKQK